MPSLEKFLARLTEEARRPFPAYNVAAIFAHPSEIIAGGATLRRLRGAHLVVVTDGVPHGYQECGALSASGTRWHELLAAAELAGHKPSSVSGLAVSQGEAAEHLVSIGRRLARIFARQGTAIALAPAYEADDPDRDATAFAVRKGAQLCRQRGQDIAVIEMPFAARDAHPAGRFAQEAGEIITLPLGTEERAIKECIRACFPAQLGASNFAADVEEFRLVPHKEPFQGRKVFTCVDEDFLSGAGALEEDFGRQAKAQA